VAAKFIRFITHEPDEVTGLDVGFFKAAYALRRENRVLVADAGHLNEILNWLDDNLDAPDRFARSRNKYAHGKALSWFKPVAVEHIDKARSLLVLLERYGVASEMLTTARPGIVVYEDDWQIAAIPFKDKDF
jgi:hypothetical protein